MAAEAAQVEHWLYGADPTPRIVAVELANAQAIAIYQRDEAGRVLHTTDSFAPWLLVQDVPTGHACARSIAPSNWRVMRPMAGWCISARGRPGTSHASFWTRPDILEGFRSPVEQYLALTGRTLFKGLVYDDPARLQLDIETTTLDPALPEARLLLVTIGSNRGDEGAIGRNGEDERMILQELSAAIAAIDPDIIEGHNLFNFDLPYLLSRAAAVGVPLAWGRDGSAAGRRRDAALQRGRAKLAVRRALRLRATYPGYVSANPAVR